MPPRGRPKAGYLPGRATQSQGSGPAEAARLVIVDDADRLQPGMNDGRTDELEAAAPEILRDDFGERRLRGQADTVTADHVTAGEGPAIAGEILAPVAHRAPEAGASDGRLDLGPGADDARIDHEPLDGRHAKARDLVGG